MILQRLAGVGSGTMELTQLRMVLFYGGAALPSVIGSPI